MSVTLAPGREKLLLLPRKAIDVDNFLHHMGRISISDRRMQFEWKSKLLNLFLCSVDTLRVIIHNWTCWEMGKTLAAYILHITC